MGKKARAAGSFLGGIANNPGIIILGLALGGLFIFRDRISSAIGGLGAAAAEGLGDINIQLPEIKLPEIKFPEIKFPDFNFPNFFGGGDIEQPQKMVENTGLLSQEESAACQCGQTITQDAFGNVENKCKICAASPGMNPALLNEPSDAELFAQDFPGDSATPPTLTPAQEFVNNLPGGFEVFQTPGSSFVGAQINPTPIENLSLSQIIEMFNVTASQAANILAIAKDDFGDFDFGTNTGGGIGSIIPSINEFIPSSDLNVSNDQFEGLSAQEIAAILTGGNISNF